MGVLRPWARTPRGEVIVTVSFQSARGNERYVTYVRSKRRDLRRRALARYPCPAQGVNTPLFLLSRRYDSGDPADGERRSTPGSSEHTTPTRNRSTAAGSSKRNRSFERSTSGCVPTNERFRTTNNELRESERRHARSDERESPPSNDRRRKQYKRIGSRTRRSIDGGTPSRVDRFAVVYQAGRETVPLLLSVLR